MFLSTLALAIVIAFITYLNPEAYKFANAAAALTFISGAAVAIERTVETFWTIIGGVLGTYWPLNVVKKQVDTMVGDLSDVLTPFYQKAAAAAAQAQTAGKMTQDELAAAQKEIAEFQRRLNEAKSLAPDNQRVQLLAASAAQSVNFLQAKIPDLEDAAKVAGTAIDGIQNFIASFKDNPGRRLISLYLGAILGLIVAGVFGLDLFKAVLENVKHPVLDVVVTGIIIGLGSNPTHEVIRAVQEFKEARKGQSAAQPDLP
jgi:hypothetical protein